MALIGRARLIETESGGWSQRRHPRRKNETIQDAKKTRMKPTFILALLMWTSLTMIAAPPSEARRGVASWYGSECSKTASGERYDPSAMTAAHRSLPFGTMVEVRNLSTGHNATVRINDRGPYSKGRLIDVSKAAAQRLKMIQSGTAKVELVVIR